MLETVKKTVARSLLDKYDFKLSKNFGQNLLTDRNIAEKIIAAAELREDDTVVEIGSGLGAMTVELSRQAGRVIAVEIDKKIIPILTEVLTGADNVEIVNEDFMKFDMSGIRGSFKLVGNLPYYITTPIIAKMLEGSVRPDLMVFMVQKEVAERISAAPGSRTYGAISVMAQYHSRVTYLMDVSREVFLPKPNVDSAVLLLRPATFEGEKPKDENLFFAVVRAGFGQRRKMLHNALGVLGADKGTLTKAFECAGIDPARRAESLGVGEFIALANAIYESGVADRRNI
ncbi:MAG: 16S rRNA (adenine(1518)-N(6)/adenine(1519)-N(6))-dimethyltransferase RsmA [Clostridiales Family XIII bacterium]|jgi:16S rRNA (adenine1518-N6/adenine1519-N6)-dimethyltransferase|nr:16S rRNA (adenine(1518)-N(6)/adenine(1519)-N(6))-dimethyltransferase RsmA [Clostridiales Family XIII bacterium]